MALAQAERRQPPLEGAEVRPRELITPRAIDLALTVSPEKVRNARTAIERLETDFEKRVAEFGEGNLKEAGTAALSTARQKFEAARAEMYLSNRALKQGKQAEAERRFLAGLADFSVGSKAALVIAEEVAGKHESAEKLWKGLYWTTAGVATAALVTELALTGWLVLGVATGGAAGAGAGALSFGPASAEIAAEAAAFGRATATVGLRAAKLLRAAPVVAGLRRAILFATYYGMYKQEIDDSIIVMMGDRPIRDKRSGKLLAYEEGTATFEDRATALFNLSKMVFIVEGVGWVGTKVVGAMLKRMVPLMMKWVTASFVATTLKLVSLESKQLALVEGTAADLAKKVLGGKVTADEFRAAMLSLADKLGVKDAVVDIKTIGKFLDAQFDRQFAELIPTVAAMFAASAAQTP